MAQQAIIRVPFSQAGSSTLVRPLGAYERMLHRYIEEHPLHFSLVAELASAVTPERLQQVLTAVQHRHPLLRVQVEDRPGTRLGFYQPTVVPAIPLSVFESTEGYTWQQLAASELATRFDPSRAPLMRVVLLRQGPTAATLIMSFEHAVADGMSAVFVLEDILAVLNGQQLPVLPVPPSQEQRLAALPSSSTPPANEQSGEAAPVDERLSAPVALRPFDGATPTISTVIFDEDLTSRLVQRCRTERTTVHAALVAATTQVMMSAGRREVVRVFTPFNFRPLLGDDVRDCVNYFSAARTGFPPAQTEDLWTLARLTGAQLAQARSEAGTRAVSAAIEQFIPVEADHAAAAGFVQHALSCEALISNLGVLDINVTGPIQPTAVWGPVLLGQFDNESVIGAATLHGQLRLVCATHAPVPDLLARLRSTLAAAC